MAFSVEMPELGESVTEGTITQWLKNVGDTVEADEPLLEVSTDKVDTEIPSPQAGTLLEIKAEEDDTVEVGDVIALIGEEGEQPADSGDSGKAEQAEAEDKQAEDKQTKDAEAEDKQAEAPKKSGGSGEATDVTMPELGESVTEGTITQWLKNVGDTVAVDEPLLEVSTDKVDTEVPSPVAGTLIEIKADEDDTVEVGDVIARVGDADAAPADSGEAEQAEAEDKQAEDKQAEDKQTKDAEAEDKQSEDKSAEAPKKSGDSGEATDVTMPELGESVTEGTITQWLKNVGDTVAVDEPLLEVSTDKVDTEVPSPVAGTLIEIKADEDDTVEVGDVIARVGDADAASTDSADSNKEEDREVPSEEATREAESKGDNATVDEAAADSGDADSGAKAEKPEQQKSATSGKVPYVTPLVRKLAEKHGVDLNEVEGTGIGGRIRKQDVLKAAEGSGAGSAESDKSGAKAGRSAASTKSVDPEKAKLRGTTQKANRIRQITAARTVEALQQTAQLTQVHEVDMTDVAALRRANKPAFQKKYGVNLTYLPFFAKAVVEALVAHPNVNASYDAETKEITYHDGVNLSIAVDTEQGLLSPVIHGADKLSLPELATAIVDVAERARSRKLRPDDLSGGTFTITNIGSEGALTDTPILVPPQAGIMGTGTIAKRPVVVSDDGLDSIAIRQVAYLPLTYDHQLVDGADAGRFMTTVVDRLETADFEADLDL